MLKFNHKEAQLLQELVSHYIHDCEPGGNSHLVFITNHLDIKEVGRLSLTPGLITVKDLLDWSEGYTTHENYTEGVILRDNDDGVIWILHNDLL